MKIALVRLTSLGDIILAMASLQIIRRSLPECRITWVADRRFADILDHQPDIQQIVRIDLRRLKKQRPLATALAAEYRTLADFGPFDKVIDLHGMIKSAAVAAILGGERYGFSRAMRKESLAGLFYNHAIPVPLELPAVCRYATLVARSLGLEFRPEDLTPPRPYLFWGAEDGAATDGYFPAKQRTVIFVAGTSAGYKNYPPEKFARLADLLGENVLVCHGNEQELATARRIAQLSPRVRVLPSLTINQLKAAVGRADLVIGGDTGPTHIAWACGVPSITLFGATPVCIRTTERNRAISTASAVNLRKPDPRDDSVSRITEEDVACLARELLA
ncbi:MAG TPA: lipopolysaccharide heptosyltransferase I [Desulfuromonadaceae bacterium]